MEYEICYLIGESRELDLEKIREDAEKIITKYKGTLLEGEFVKKRRLSYAIKNEARGTYVAKRFTLPGKDEREENYPGEDFIGEMTKEFNFNQDVLRFIIIKADELPSLKEAAATEEKNKENNPRKDYANKEGRRPYAEKRETAKKFEVKKAPIIKEAKEEIIKEKSAPKAEEPISMEAVKEEEAKVVEAKTTENKKAQKEEKPKKKKDVKDEISDDNIDEKLDEILNI